MQIHPHRRAGACSRPTSSLFTITYYLKFPPGEGIWLAARLAWGFIKPILDRDDARYWNQVEKCSRAGKASAEKRRKKRVELCSEQNPTSGNIINQSTIFNPQSTIDNLQSTDINLQSSDGNHHYPIIKSGDEVMIPPTCDEVSDFDMKSHRHHRCFPASQDSRCLWEFRRADNIRPCRKKKARSIFRCCVLLITSYL